MTIYPDYGIGDDNLPRRISSPCWSGLRWMGIFACTLRSVDKMPRSISSLLSGQVCAGREDLPVL